MIVYAADCRRFRRDVLSNQVERRILDAFQTRLGHSAGRREVESWRNSLQYMNNALIGGNVPDDAGVAIEYRIPQTAKRIDFILTGKNDARKDTAVVVELKQWESAKATSRDGIVETFVGGGRREVPHPSYQAWTYAALIRDFNEAVQEQDIELAPCAYLHNCVSEKVLRSTFYKDHLDRAPVFLKRDAERLQQFLYKNVRYGDTGRVLYQIENGRIRPSRNLADHLTSLLHGNRDFLLIDDQKVVYEKAIEISKVAQGKRKQVLIVEGGPGTGKSVVAINLLVRLTAERMVTQYVTRNAAPRAVYQAKLTGSFKKGHVTNLFKGSGAYIGQDANTIDVLVVDEAHRLNEKSGMYKNLGENQVKEIIHAAKASVFFIDEDQRVTINDIGSKEEIRRWARSTNAAVHELELSSQFRCNGSDGYLAWVDHALQIRETANQDFDGIDYDFRVFDDPNRLHEAIVDRNRTSNSARVVAGYCWDWKGKKDASIKDVSIPEHGFARRWNLDTDGSLWILQQNSVHEIGCIHTCQGLELEYVGVIIGPDLVVRDGVVQVDATKRASQDSSIRGYKKMLKQNRHDALKMADRIVRNTYRTLMTRGRKGCYLFCVDPETNEYFRRIVDGRATRPRSEDPAAPRWTQVAEPKRGREDE